MSSNTESVHHALPDALHGASPRANMGQSWSLREAADVCGVSLDTIKRRRRDGRFPGALMVNGGWQIPSVELAEVAASEGWSLVLPDASPSASPSALHGAEQAQSTDPALDVLQAVRVAELEAQLVNAERLHAAELERERAERIAEVGPIAAALEAKEAGLERAAQDLARVTAERDRHRSDVDHLRAELERVKGERAEADKQRAVAQALAEDRADQLTKAEDRADDIEHRADAIAAERDRVVGLLGWRGRAKYRKGIGTE